MAPVTATSDHVIDMMRATMECRLEACDPSVLDTYAEHLVAFLIGGRFLLGWLGHIVATIDAAVWKER